MGGFTRKRPLFIPVLRSADYTSLFRRMKELDLSLRIDPRILSHDVIVAVDCTGINVTNWGEWMRETWRVQRGWIKVHAMNERETDQIPGLEVTDEPVQDDPLFTLLLDQSSENCKGEYHIHEVLGDGRYDRIHVFNTMEERGIKPGIKTRENAASRFTGSPYRAECDRNSLI